MNLLIALWVWKTARGKGMGFYHLALDIAILLLCVIYQSIKLQVNAIAETVLTDTTGALIEVPWRSKDIALDSKIDSFFENLTKLEDRMAEEEAFAIFSFVVVFAVLFRIVISTAAHPRTAILVSTLKNASDDLWHFLILLALLFTAFCLVGHNRFGHFDPSFATISASLETLFEMMLGSMPENFGEDALLSVFTICFNFIVFFLMLNFVIAIIVEAYLKVKTEVEENEAENEFFTDLVSSFYAVSQGKLHGWPDHAELIQSLEGFAKKNVCRGYLNLIWPDWKIKSMNSFMEYYSQYEFVRPTPSGDSQNENWSECQVIVSAAVKQLTNTMAALLDRPIPTPAEVELVAHRGEKRKTKNVKKQEGAREQNGTATNGTSQKDSTLHSPAEGSKETESTVTPLIAVPDGFESVKSERQSDLVENNQP
eukprot:CAMPEP_0184302900 /NCGR_PEP_ID=MMETSP1049-20130417/12762_1 /TAXON_ID=77928 /ORGANISM="Proteomonas sulcata, Strain CCMP704" /LENGTH=425 /DNA_ID=CAMNT_0026614299 /DNA_START=59 /DNA_END=1336 /DNA_ORIENTATION=+